MTILLVLALNSSRAADPRAPALIYEIFTQSFSDSNGDGIGDLPGIESRLDYIQSLGADGIWLTPIFESPSYHGYDVSDYLTIKAVYGTEQDLHDLVNQAHARGIRVLLDLPVNHTSIQHPWFQSNTDYYMWSPTPLDWTDIDLNPGEPPEDHWHLFNAQYYFTSFTWDMPDLNWLNQAVYDEIQAVFLFWNQFGADGYRLDAAKYLVKGPDGEQNMPQTHQIWKNIVASVRAQNPNSYFVGEVWDTAANIAPYYGSGDELDAAFDFPVEGAIRTSLTESQGSSFYGALVDQLSTELDPFFALPFVGSHDLDRLATVLSGDLHSQKLAALSFMTLPGTPVLYYGDEVGMQNGNVAGDLAQRMPMDWTEVAAQEQDPGSLLSTYRQLSELRRSLSVLQTGLLNQPTLLGTSAVSFLRDSGALVVLNFGNSELAPTVVNIPSGSQPHLVYGVAQLQSLSSTQVVVNGLGAKQGIVLQLQ